VLSAWAGVGATITRTHNMSSVPPTRANEFDDRHTRRIAKIRVAYGRMPSRLAGVEASPILNPTATAYTNNSG